MLKVGDVVILTRLDATGIDHRAKPIGVVDHVYSKSAEVVWPMQSPDRDARLSRRHISIEWLTDLQKIENNP